jgi:hypothetical protein
MSDLDPADQIWRPAKADRLKLVVVYGDVQVRDWRWLWLRKRTRTEILAVNPDYR